MDIFNVVLSKQAEKDLKRLPDYIVVKLWSWVDAVEHEGLKELRKISGYHDEPLQGKRKGQRSIRLSKAYQAIYEVKKNEIEFIEIIGVNKYDY